VDRGLVSVHVHGAFVASRDGKVQIRPEDGSLLNLKPESLTPIDPHWARDRASESLVPLDDLGTGWLQARRLNPV
jgi:hypothetical protein